MRFLVILLAVCACSRPAPVGVVAATSERDAELKPAEGAIGGVIRDAADGKPLSMVSIQAEQDGKQIAHDISDYTGRYRLNPLAPGRYDVSAKFADARVQHKDIIVEQAKETELKVSIELGVQAEESTADVATRGPPGSIQGLVVDGADGNIVPGTVVSLSAPHLEDVVMAIADENGTFQFRGLRPGVYNLSSYYTLVDQGSVEVRKSNVVVEPGQATSVELRVDLRLN